MLVELDCAPAQSDCLVCDVSWKAARELEIQRDMANINATFQDYQYVWQLARESHVPACVGGDFNCVFADVVPNVRADTLSPSKVPWKSRLQSHHIWRTAGTILIG